MFGHIANIFGNQAPEAVVASINIPSYDRYDDVQIDKDLLATIHIDMSEKDYIDTFQKLIGFELDEWEQDFLCEDMVFAIEFGFVESKVRLQIIQREWDAMSQVDKDRLIQEVAYLETMDLGGDHKFYDYI